MHANLNRWANFNVSTYIFNFPIHNVTYKLVIYRYMFYIVVNNLLSCTARTNYLRFSINMDMSHPIFLRFIKFRATRFIHTFVSIKHV